ncbi:hypothetical protein B0H17DRAFT_1038719 [Mycena rosella]|uniref:Uncharacterized protein n=1 Tax=Mycena rosella TaxID=1033263 RepID=A0AAD7M7X5_MYCRO|nr:hypothetical protein B0H17DRAFT_1038719 [Mycena rosella]
MTAFTALPPADARHCVTALPSATRSASTRCRPSAIAGAAVSPPTRTTAIGCGISASMHDTRAHAHPQYNVHHRRHAQQLPQPLCIGDGAFAASPRTATNFCGIRPLPLQPSPVSPAAPAAPSSSRSTLSGLFPVAHAASITFLLAARAFPIAGVAFVPSSCTSSVLATVPPHRSTRALGCILNTARGTTDVPNTHGSDPPSVVLRSPPPCVARAPLPPSHFLLEARAHSPAHTTHFSPARPPPHPPLDPCRAPTPRSRFQIRTMSPWGVLAVRSK